MKADDILEITDENFEKEVLHSRKPVVLNFRASWCRRCDMNTGLFERLARKYRGVLKVGTVDADRFPILTVKLEVEALPALVIIKQGEVVDRVHGPASEEMILNRLYSGIPQRRVPGGPKRGTRPRAPVQNVDHGRMRPRHTGAGRPTVIIIRRNSGKPGMRFSRN